MPLSSKIAVLEERFREGLDARPSRGEAEAAVATLLRWSHDDPTREGLLDTPARVVRAFDEYFSGYDLDAVAILQRTFDEVEGYDEIVLLSDIPFTSHCEHHLAPIQGVAHVAYLPDRRVVGISKLARTVDVYARRLQIQEKMTAQIADAINTALRPRAVSVVIQATHGCMTMRGILKSGARLTTSRTLGLFRSDAALRRQLEVMMAGGTTAR
jgi:GTP cyclohydrolase I